MRAAAYGGLVLLGCGAGIAGSAAFLAQRPAIASGRIAPGVRIADVAVGGMTPDAARARVRTWAHEQSFRKFTLTAPVSRRRWNITVGDIGGRFDIDSSLQAASRIGRDQTRWDTILQGGRTYDVRIEPAFHYDPARLNRQLARIAAIVHTSPRAARAVMAPVGGLTITAPEQNGVDLDIAATRAALLQRGSADLLHGAQATLTIQETRPAVCADDLSKVDTLLGKFTTDYGSSSANRRHNVELAAARIDGMILAPDAVFSYNQTVGPRTSRLGWRDAPTYQDGQVVPSPGGGVCQVSTTLYNAVLRAGLTIVLRSHHSMPVHYVEPGRDATVAYDDLDFRFQNSTHAPLLIAARAVDGTLAFSLYGEAAAKHGEITLASSQHTPTANGGFSVTTYRVRRAPAGTITREILSTDTYDPTPSSRIAAGATHPAPPKAASPITPAEPTAPRKT